MELRHLRYFVAVAEERNFTRAAARFGIGQPPLSQQIKDLESEVGVQLFRRLPHGAELTPAGEAFLDKTRSVLSGAQQACVAAKRAARGESGQLRLGFTGSAAFNPVVPGTIRSFTRDYPGVQLSLVETNSRCLVDGLLEGEIDAAFIRHDAHDRDGLRMRKVAEEPMLIVLPSDHRSAARRRLPLEELAAEPFILYPRSMGPELHDAITGACRAAGFEPVIGQDAPQMSSIINLVATGAGVSVAPASLSRIAVEGVRYLAIDGTAPVARLTLAWRRDTRTTTLKNFLTLTASLERTT